MIHRCYRACSGQWLQQQPWNAPNHALQYRTAGWSRSIHGVVGECCGCMGLARVKVGRLLAATTVREIPAQSIQTWSGPFCNWVAVPSAVLIADPQWAQLLVHIHPTVPGHQAAGREKCGTKRCILVPSGTGTVRHLATREDNRMGPVQKCSALWYVCSVEAAEEVTGFSASSVSGRHRMWFRGPDPLTLQGNPPQGLSPTFHSLLPIFLFERDY